MSVSFDTKLPPIFTEATGHPNSWMISADANTGNAIKFEELTR